MFGPSESDSSDSSGGDSDRDGTLSSFHDSELSDTHTHTRKRRQNLQIQGRAWSLTRRDTKNLIHNVSDPASMDGDADDEEAKVENTNL